MGLTLLQPIWLVLWIPLVGVLCLWKMPTRFLGTLRIAVLVLVVLAICEPALRLARRHGLLVVVADRSASMPAEADARMTEMIQLLSTEKSPEDQLAVVTFGQRAMVESEGGTETFSGFAAQVGSEGSNLAEALERSLALVERNQSARLLVLSDGRFTGRDPARIAMQCAGQGVPVDYRLLSEDVTGDVAIERIDAPQTAMPGEVCLLTVWINSQQAGEISYELLRNEVIVGRGTQRVGSGRSSLSFRDRIGSTGTQIYRFRVQGSQNDPVPENNYAKVLIGVSGPKPVLAPTQKAGSGLVTLLQREGLDIESRPANQCTWTLEEMSRYSAVLLEDVPANEIGKRSMENLQVWIKETGTGLMVTGGRNSYGPGGYFRSPLEEILPISMELRREHRKLAVGIVVALDRSGSMAAPVGLGKTKMDLANIASAQVLDMLTPKDELGVVAVDSESHVIADIRPIEQNSGLRNQILSIQSMGGGIFVYEALKTASAMVARAQAGTKHIILFADAADAEQPGDYRDLLAHCQAAGITVSVVGLGTEHDSDAAFLRDVAARGNGRCFFTTDPEELPRLFAQDTFVVMRSSFIEETTSIKATASMATLRPEAVGALPAVGGYNLCYLRDEATMAAVSQDEYEAPIVASWQVGIGRVACYTGEADGEYAGPMATWEQVGGFYSSLARWCIGQGDDLGQEMMVTQRLDNGVCKIQLHLDPERDHDPFTTIPQITTLIGHRDRETETQVRSMQWVQADLLELELELTGSETVLSTVTVDGVGKAALTPVCLPYSPEFKPATIDQNASHALTHLAEVSGGVERVDLGGIWQNLTARPRLVRLSPLLSLLAIVLFLLEIFQRRTGLLRPLTWSRRREQKQANAPEKRHRSRAQLPHWLKRAQKRPGSKTSKRAMLSTAKKKTPAAKPSVPESLPNKPTPPAEESSDILDAMKRARQQRRW